MAEEIVHIRLGKYFEINGYMSSVARMARDPDSSLPWNVNAHYDQSVCLNCPIKLECLVGDVTLRQCLIYTQETKWYKK